MILLVLLIIALGVWGVLALQNQVFESGRKRRQAYYHDYLKSDAWQRKRYVVFKRDNWRCVYCGKHATEVHHKKYAKYNIGKEPIKWLVSVCKDCHASIHS